ncbi:protein DEK isoform X2 [Bacillus rossius redtenbacheri]|uniref:protein DEK isoform X2 n=1 Tax=Bacillus rossius redtenbacheri TaxID=93214 RepID=UPI002FDEEFF3
MKVEDNKKDEVEGTKNGADEKSSDESSEKGKKVPPKKRATKTKEPKKEVKKEDKRKEKKKETEDEDEEEDESAETDAQVSDSSKVPLLDQPLELEGTRERKKVQRFTEEFKAEHQTIVPIDIPEGKGDCLGEIPRINAFLQTYRVDNLKPLHRLLFGRLGKTTLIKNNIKKFNGFDFAKGSDQFEKKKNIISKLDVRNLKVICSVLDLDKKGTRDDLVVRIAEFLVCPKDSGRPAPAARPKRSSAQKANKRGFSESEDEHEAPAKPRRKRGKLADAKEGSASESEEKNAKAAGGRRRRKTESDTEGKESEQDEPEAEAEQEEEEEEEEDDADKGDASGEESDEPKSKKKAKSNANVNSKKAVNKKSAPKKTANKKAEKKQTGKKRKEKDDKIDGNESSEDEPLSKKSKNPPTDDEIKIYVKEILEGADLEEITMKTVCKQVYGHYPDFDLSHKKDFIKTTVKSLISP